MNPRQIRRGVPCVAATPSSRALSSLDRGKSTALHLLHQFRQLGAEAGGLGFVPMHDGVFKQRIQPLDFLNRFVSLWHRHDFFLLRQSLQPIAQRQEFFKFGDDALLLGKGREREYGISNINDYPIFISNATSMFLALLLETG